MNSLRRLLERGAEAGVFAGAVGLVRVRGRTVFRAAVGWAEMEPGRRSMSLNTVFDLASLTKVLCTVPVVLRLCAQGVMDLEAPLGRWLPAAAHAPCGRVTVREALAHTGGLAPWRALYLGAWGREAVVEAVARLPLEARPGERVGYSDLGVMLVGAAVEGATGKRLDVLFEEHVARPLGLQRSRFCPPAHWRKHCAATERGNGYERDLAGKAGADFAWREGVIVGEVHDGNAHYALEGVAAHAGLFSNAEEAARVMEAWLGYERWIPEAYRTEALSDQRGGAEGAPRGLGWMLYHPAAFFASLGPRSFGHTGFTGTSVAADPDRGLVVVLLTNRVHPQVREGIGEFRKAFHEMVLQSIE